MKIAIASDHAGYDMKEKIKSYFKDYIFVDCGTNNLSSVDYPDYAYKASKEVINNNVDFGILLCGTGIGISIAANKIKGIRCALLYNKNVASLSKEHNNANMIAFGARELEFEKICDMIKIYIQSKFEIRHQKRLDKIKQIEGGNNE